MRTSWQAPEDGWLIVWLSGLAGAVVGWLSGLAELAAWPQGATAKQGPEEVQCGVQNKSSEPARRVWCSFMLEDSHAKEMDRLYAGLAVHK